MTQKADHPEFKIVFVGNSIVGKTSIITRYSQNNFFADSQSTIALGLCSKVVETPHGTALMHIWDTAGQERYQSLVPVYSRGASVAVIVFDTSDPDGFAPVPEWVEKMRQDVAQDCKVIIVGNKIDLPQKIDREKSVEWAKKGGYPLMFASARSGYGINELFGAITESFPSAKFSIRESPPINVKEKHQKDGSHCC